MAASRKFLLAGVLFAVLEGGGQLLAQGIVAPSLIEAPLAAQPTDVAVTPDGDFAVVRSTAPILGTGNTSLVADHISVWDLQQRTRLALFQAGIPGSQPAGRGEFGAGSEVSDLVVTTNGRCLCAGSGTVAVGLPNAGLAATFGLSGRFSGSEILIGARASA